MDKNRNSEAPDWGDDPGGDDDIDDMPSGTDADFSGDTTTSMPVSDDDGPEPRFETLVADAEGNEELRAFLAGSSKAVLVHKSHQYAQHLDEVVGYARRQTRDRCSVGLVVPLRQPRHTVRAFMARFPNTALRLADPQIHLHRDHYDEVTAKVTSHWPHFSSPMPDPPDRDWTLQLLTEQARCGATMLLTPTGKVEEANAQASLSDAMDRVALARSIVGEAPLFVNLTFDHRWLSQRTLRDRLLNEIVDSSERNWYLRFRWPIVEPAYGQLNDRAILDGYAELSTLCADEDKVLILPNSDLTGWVATALGAAGFGTATSISDRRFAEKRRMGAQAGQPRPEPKKRYFSRSVLHTIEQSAHERLVGEPGYKVCSCKFCVTTLMPDRSAPTAWDLPAAGYHYVQKAAMLTSSIAADPRPNARSIVRRAIQFVEALPPTKQLISDDRPRHLETWRALLT